MMEKNLKNINIPFFGKDTEVLMSIEEIRKSYLTGFEIIKSELSSENIEFVENGNTKTGKYISGIDIYLEKRKDLINEILFDKLKLIYSKIENDHKTDNQIDRTFSAVIEDIFPNINYNYWMNMNPFYADTQLLPTMKTCIRHYASLPGLINDVLQDIDLITCKDLVKLIEIEIKNIVEHNLFNDESKVLRIFDLISGWGGKQGRAPYLRPLGNTTRNSYKNWYSNYILGAKCAINNKNEALKYFTTINFIGDSFGTKHLYFWSLYGGNAPVPIYDARIKTLLYLSIDEAPSFEQYVEDMNNFSIIKNITINQLEKALFAFSSNYFPNETLIMKNEIIDKTDYLSLIHI